jgi:hypothetical protein
MELTSSIKRLSGLSALATKSLFGAASLPSRWGARPMSSSPIEPSALSGPGRDEAVAEPAVLLVPIVLPGPIELLLLLGQLLLMSLEMITRDVPMSKRTSHEPEDSNIGLVTPAIYAGLEEASHQACVTAATALRTHTDSHSSRLVRFA